MYIKLILIPLVIFLNSKLADGTHSFAPPHSFAYRQCVGPSDWYMLSADCGGNAQSPINIQTKNVETKRSATLFMKYFNSKIKSVTLINDGHSVVMNFKFANQNDNELFWMETLMHTKKFHLELAHLHWGTSSTGGSEHLIDGHRYAAELHLIHYNSIYNNFNDAKFKPDGLSIVAILFEFMDEELAVEEDRNNNVFIEYLKFIKNENDLFEIKNETQIFTIKDLIVRDVEDFYAYQGSLTTPPCNENVRWFISKTPIPISKSEIHDLNTLWSKIGPITTNYRPIQPLNGRKVEEFSNNHIINLI